ncbi:acyl-CoA thioesterase/BAAT N-terminal domain-containing protein [uncultured Leifsonia sp.]|uniref:acyl-CoA thioesterase/BAAT N-terminal domain-containing protein n=1 Tax=uncultured Leifsonia sp. TaxID=340359 RepID=UPI0025F91A3E|nr:acyl-CoA thioesterase/BAAT N-terminal domain-containing protein [uncultured Leifsonia sp.]
MTRERNRTVRHRVLAVLAAVAISAVALTGCGSPSGSAGPRFQLSADPSPVWQPVGIRIVSLPPGQQVTIHATLRRGGSWTSQAVYAVPADGVVDLATDAPLEAPFTGADGMGLFWTMRGATGEAATSDVTWGGSSFSVDLRASVGGRPVAETHVQRVGLTAAAPVRAVFDDGITGDYFEPAGSAEGVRPGIIVFDGTDPGQQTGVLAAATLAALGFPTLDLSTYGSAGQLEPLRSLSAERFLTALGWLRSQPGVDDQRIFTFGTSRGAPLALWAAAAYPGTVYGAIAPGGTTGLICPSPVPSPAVTVDGAWVPCTTGTHDPAPAAVLDIERIPGPVVLGCAGKDEMLANGCAWLDAAARKRPQREGDAYLRAPDATHLFYLPPYTPLLLPEGSAAQPTERAREALWADILAALTAPSSVPGR